MQFQLLLSITDKLLGQLPNYDERKKNEFYELKLSFVNEKAKKFPDRDDDLIMNLRDKLVVWIEAFNSEQAKK